MGKWQMVIRKWLKAGIISYILLTEGVNGSVKSKVFGQGVGAGSRAWMGRVGMGGRFDGEGKWRASRSVRSCENG